MPTGDAKQKRKAFAAAIVAGKSKTQAYLETHPGSKLKRPGNKAHDLSRTPDVAREIRRLTWLECPPLGDLSAMRGHAVRVISDLSRFAEDESVRMKCAIVLLELADKMEAATNPPATMIEQENILKNLRAFYSKIEFEALTHAGELEMKDEDAIDIQAIGGPE